VARDKEAAVTRFVQLAVLSIAAAVAGLLWYAVATWPHAAVPWIIAAAWTTGTVLALAYTAAEMLLDIEERRARCDQEWGRAERIWIDLDGDGEVDEGEMMPRVVSIRARATEQADAGFVACRDVLRWAYSQDAAGLSWGQHEGHRHFGPTRYDYAFSVFATMGLVEGRRKRVQGRLTWPTYQSALDTLKEKWQEGGGLCQSAANLGADQAGR
jgi:hypothetical protein